MIWWQKNEKKRMCNLQRDGTNSGLSIFDYSVFSKIFSYYNVGHYV